MTVLGCPRRWNCPWLPVLILLLGTDRGPGVHGVTHYKAGDPVILYVNKVGPYHNPQETYHYYQLPVCCPEKIRHKSLSLGEVLDGDRMAESLYEIRFRENVEKRVLCHMQLSSAQVSLCSLAAPGLSPWPLQHLALVTEGTILQITQIRAQPHVTGTAGDSILTKPYLLD